MPCSHLQELYEVAKKHDLKIAASDAVHIVCRQCNEEDTCPTALTDGEKVLHLNRAADETTPSSETTSS